VEGLFECRAGSRLWIRRRCGLSPQDHNALIRLSEVAPIWWRVNCSHGVPTVLTTDTLNPKPEEEIER
jgi:hypothetical protein